MVLKTTAVMSSRHEVREVVAQCEECHLKMQAIGELLLLSCEARPVFTEVIDMELTNETFKHFRDKVIDKLNHILIASRDISSQIHSGAVHWKSLTQRLVELSSLVVSLTELSAHIGYLIAVNFQDSRATRLGVVNKYKLCQAKLDLKFCCQRLKRSCVDDLDPHLLVTLCSTISKALSTMTEVCKHASERAKDAEDQNQFKLCIKSITSTTSCLISSVKCFKSSPCVDHLRRIIAFCDPVIATSSALVTFASEEEFVGSPAQLSEKATATHKSVLDAQRQQMAVLKARPSVASVRLRVKPPSVQLCGSVTMSIVSASIQMCKAIRDLVYDLTNSRHRERIRLCVESIDKASSKLRDLLLSCDFEKQTTFSSQMLGASGLSVSSTSLESTTSSVSDVQDSLGD